MMKNQNITHAAAAIVGVVIGAGLLALAGDRTPPAASIPAPIPVTESATPHGNVPSPPGGEGARRAGEGAAETGFGALMETRTTPSSGLRPPSPPAGEGTDRELIKGYDLDGKMIRLGEQQSCRAIVLVFLGTECPIARGSVPKLNRLSAEVATHGVEFYGVYSDPFLNRSDLRSHMREFSVRFPVLFDVTGELAGRLENEITPQAFVLSPEGEVQYSGAIDEQFPALTRRAETTGREHLRKAIADVLAGRSVEVALTEPVGCRVTRNEIRPPTFHREIAPIVYGNCSTCHHAGAVAPFPLVTRDDLRRHAEQIRVMVDLQLMPPWKPSPGFGHFADDLRLTKRERQLLSRWAGEASPQAGDEADACPEPSFPLQWQLGEPDLVLPIPATEIPADGPDIYQYSVLPMPLREDRLVAAIEYRSSNPRVVHHASFRYDDAGNARRLGSPAVGLSETGIRRYRQFGGWGFWSGGTLGGWALGVLPKRLPDGFGRPIKANSDFVLQTHYHPSGKPETERAEIGIYFAPKTTRRRIAELFVADIDLRIPPGERSFRHRASYTLPVETTLHAVLPHTHLLGRTATAIATLPDGQTEPLVRIEDWDFNWQGQYFYRRPVILPAGTRIDFEVVFDNSTLNPQNPNSPPATVTWGEQTTHEMAVCFFDVSTRTETKLDELLKHNRRYIADQEFRLTGRTSGAFGNATR